MEPIVIYTLVLIPIFSTCVALAWYCGKVYAEMRFTAIDELTLHDTLKLGLQRKTTLLVCLFGFMAGLLLDAFIYGVFDELLGLTDQVM